jgi:signal transduction histidine kinase
MQLVYLTYHYLLFKRKDFLYYGFFTISFTVFFASFAITPFREFGERLTNGNLFLTTVTFLMFGAAMYYRFIRYFTDLEIHAPRFNKVMRVTEYCLITSSILMFSNTMFLERKLDFVYPIVRFIYFVNFIVQFYAIIYLLRSRNLVNIMVGIGSIALGVFVKAGIMPIVYKLQANAAEANTFNFVLTGLIFDFLCFNFALIYKSRQIEIEKTKLQIQKQTALYQQRVEIGNDLHDDVGATLSSLHVYSTIAEKELDRDPIMAKKYMRRIATGIRTVMENMNDVIWAVNINKQEGKSFSSRIKDFNIDLFDAKNIECTYDIDPKMEQQITRMLVRKNLLLITKEAINNIIKHSGATKVTISLKEHNNSLALSIRDNGIGISGSDTHHNGNGLPSLELRAQQLGGTIQIETSSEKGTQVHCSIPLANISD